LRPKSGAEKLKRWRWWARNWSRDQLREDKFYRFNQTLQELLNLAAKVSA